MSDSRQKNNKYYETPARLDGQKRFKLIACEIIYREICKLVAEARHVVDADFLRKGLHDAGREVMCSTLQEAISQVDEEIYDAVLLGYGRCNNGLAGIKAGGIPLVIPRAHDCITLFFGSRREYDKWFALHPGTYYRTSGWTERDKFDSDSVMHQLGLDSTYDEYVAKYGKDNADYIMQQLGRWEDNYQYLAYIDMGLPIDQEYIASAQAEARRKNLEFLRLSGKLGLLRQLLAGNWNENEFLIVPPGATVVATEDGKILSFE